jgi:Uma2 family endonuclease
MATGTQARFLSVQEYLESEQDGQVRHEYVAGQVYAMTGGSVYHNRIAGNFFAELRAKLGQRGCDVFLADMKLQRARASIYEGAWR